MHSNGVLKLKRLEYPEIFEPLLKYLHVFFKLPLGLHLRHDLRGLLCDLIFHLLLLLHPIESLDIHIVNLVLQVFDLRHLGLHHFLHVVNDAQLLLVAIVGLLNFSVHFYYFVL